MSNYTHNFEQVKDMISVEDVARHYGIEFNRNNKALCPFHDEKTPSFSLHRSKSYAKCFGCDASVDAIELEYKMASYDNRWEAARALNDRYRLGIHFNGFDKEKAEEISNTHELLNSYCKQANKDLLENKEVLEWLERKGITVEDVKEYCIGYVGNGWLKGKVTEKSRALALKLGLLKEDGGKVYEVFRHRIIFPVYRHGKIVSLWARRYPDTEGSVKYIGLPCSEFIPHKPIAFGENLNCGTCVVTESISDAIAFIKADIPACSPIGTEISQYQSTYFEKAKARLYFVPDPDESGKEASYRLAKAYKGYMVDLGYDTDPDAVLAELGIEEFKRLVEKAISEATYYLDVVIEKESLSSAIDEVAKIEDASERERWLKKLSEKYAITLGSLKEDVKSRRKVKPEDKEAPEPTLAEKKYSGYFSGLVDLVEDDNGRVSFLVKEVDELVVKSSVIVDGETYYPPEMDTNIRKVLRCLPRAAETIKYYKDDSDLAIYNDLLAYHKQVSELPDERLYELVAAWVIHTYLMENFTYSPYIWLYSIPEKGKTRTGRGAINVACRGMHIETLRDAHLIRFASDWKATLFIDVLDLWSKAEKSGSEDFLLQRHERGAIVVRVLYPERGSFKDTAFYDIFGATFIATNEGIHPALESRAILITMREADRAFDDIPMDIARSLKERLVAFRARHLGKPQEEVEKPAKGRLGDILKPLVQIIRLVAPQREKDFIDLISDLDAQRRAQKSESTEAKLISKVYALEYAVEEGFLKNQTILDAYNEGIQDRYKISDRSLGWKLTALGFAKDKFRGARGIRYDKTLLDRLMMSFGLKDPPTPGKKRPERPERPKPNNDDELGVDVLLDNLDKTSTKRPDASASKHWTKDNLDVLDISSESREEAKNHKEGNAGNGSVIKRQITKTPTSDGQAIYHVTDYKKDRKVVYFVHPGESEYESIEQEWEDEQPF